MEYNVCKTCGAGEGRAGLLINGECKNCHDTRKSGNVVIHSYLIRSQLEINRTMMILDEE